jgi:hypothetical protein
MQSDRAKLIETAQALDLVKGMVHRALELVDNDPDLTRVVLRRAHYAVLLQGRELNEFIGRV